jgi:dTDP-glucose pyrophosphorylase
VINPDDEEAYCRLFGDGRQCELEISYALQPKPGGIAEVFITGRESWATTGSGWRSVTSTPGISRTAG